MLPGYWQAAAYHCERGTKAWMFRPLVASQPALLVAPGTDGWRLAEGGEIVECPGNFGGAWEKQK